MSQLDKKEKRKLINRRYYLSTHKNLTKHEFSKQVILPLLNEEIQKINEENTKLRKERILYNIKSQNVEDDVHTQFEEDTNDEALSFYKNRLEIYKNEFGIDNLERKLEEFELYQPFRDDFTNYEKCCFYDKFFEMLDF